MTATTRSSAAAMVEHVEELAQLLDEAGVVVAAITANRHRGLIVQIAGDQDQHASPEAAIDALFETFQLGQPDAHPTLYVRVGVYPGLVLREQVATTLRVELFCGRTRALCSCGTACNHGGA